MFSATSPELAAKIANATANAYIAEQIGARAQSARQGGLWLEERIDHLRKQMNAAALQAQEFRAKRDYRISGNRGDAVDPKAWDTRGQREQSAEYPRGARLYGADLSEDL